MVGACPQAPNKADHDGSYSFRRLGRTQEDDLGDKVKTDRRDAMMLAQTLRAGQLTFWVPDEAHEAMRDLGRLRAQAMRDLRKTRQQLLSFLLRLGSRSPYGHWTKMHRRWLGELTFAHPAQHLAHEEMLQRIERAEAPCDRLKQAIAELLPQWSLAPVVQAILRGVSLVVAAVIVAEVGSFGRFENPRQLMAFLGLNPSARGATIRRGTGNALARTCLVAAAIKEPVSRRPVPQIGRMRRKGNPRSGFDAGIIRCAFASQRKPHDEPWSCTNPRIRANSTVVHASCRRHWAPICSSITCKSRRDQFALVSLRT